MRLVHYSKAPVTAVHSVEQDGRMDSKPRGIWVSDDAAENNWRAWCEGESWGMDRLRFVHDVTLAASANVLFVRSAAEIDMLTATYGLRDKYCLQIQWDAVARDRAGIIITPYVYERRLYDDASWYYSWDCASGCIWDASAIQSVTLRGERKAA